VIPIQLVETGIAEDGSSLICLPIPFILLSYFDNYFGVHFCFVLIQMYLKDDVDQQGRAGPNHYPKTRGATKTIIVTHFRKHFGFSGIQALIKVFRSGEYYLYYFFH
jgi:hypothetical protein